MTALPDGARLTFAPAAGLLARIAGVLDRERACCAFLKFVSIPVRDQDRALAFYTEQLGCRIVTDSPFDGVQRWIELAFPRAETRLVLFTVPGRRP